METRTTASSTDKCIGPSPDLAAVANDGRIDIDLDSKTSQAFAKLIQIPGGVESEEPPPAYSFPASWDLTLNVVLQVVGSRGDVQPFIAIGAELQRCGHRVRLATHHVFQDFVKEAGLEFYPIGGDPTELISYMVRNPGLVPRMKTLKDGEIGRKRRMIQEMLKGCWESCISPDPESGNPFVANAIIANPPSFAHIHCAQALAVPLHMVFTMPWSPTQAFPHPLANIRPTAVKTGIANYLSYGLVDCLMWQGLGDVINKFRSTIDLEPVPVSEGPFLPLTLRVPHTYCWSPALVPKPDDWPHHIDVCGFIFRDAPKYSPPLELEVFLAAGPPPLYIGFGSIVVDDPTVLTANILEAIETCKVRAIVSTGWSNLAAGATNTKNVFYLDNCPHEWLFPRVSAVIHHGGAGTTACGLLNGRPTTIVPFFGDQIFWGDLVAAASAGPPPIPHKTLTKDGLIQAIRFCLREDTVRAAARVAHRMKDEAGVKGAVASFHRHLNVNRLQCDILPHLPAVWGYSIGKESVKLSGAATKILLQNHLVQASNLQIYQANPISIENHRLDPISATCSAMLGVPYDLLGAANDIWRSPYELHRQMTKENGPNAPIAPGQIAQMVCASAMSVPKIFSSILKGFIIDMPLAVAEGMREMPRIYGNKVEGHDTIVDWSSGTVVAEKEVTAVMQTGFFEVANELSKVDKEEGAMGKAKGISRGLLTTVSRAGSAAIGLVAYPAQGLYKSAYAATHSMTKMTIVATRLAEQAYLSQTQGDRIDIEHILQTYRGITARE